MECSNCHNFINIDSTQCPFCGMYNPKSLKDNSDVNWTICIDNEVFPLYFQRKPKIYIGRKDINYSPDIDLGPFDLHLTLSRNHGFFIEKDELLYYTDLSKNGSTLNGVLLKKNQQYPLHDLDFICLSEVTIQVVKKI